MRKTKQTAKAVDPFAEMRKTEWLPWALANLIGPKWGRDEELLNSPLDQYCTGMLLPAGDVIAGDAANGETPVASSSCSGDKSSLTVDLPENDETTSTDNIPNAAIGLSFLVTHDIKLEVGVVAARYKYETRRHVWIRMPCPETNIAFSPPNAPKTVNKQIDHLGADITIRWRKHGRNWLVTAALINRNHTGGGPRFGEEMAKTTLFQTQLTCTALKGKILPYPHTTGVKFTAEEEDLDMQYRDRKVYAIGHSVAADWDDQSLDHTFSVRTNYLPSVEVPLVTTNISEIPSNVLDIDFLSRCQTEPEKILPLLNQFVAAYENWVDSEHACWSKRIPDSAVAVDRITARQRQSVERMRKGIELLKNNDKACRAFALAQAAMLQQMTRIRMLQGKLKTETQYPILWRPFQLAFILMTIESVLDPECGEDRDIVDLLWFPTGGGKTEAYLALIATLIIYRRLKWPTSGSGTSVIMRYTLRLLTAQQFQRATALICALEMIRRNNHRELGVEPISGGLWVGGASTPNTNREAQNILNELRSGKPGSHGLFLDQCPWCGRNLVPDKVQSDRVLGVRSKGQGIEFFCPDSNCDFHSVLPLHVVDEHLYEHPPTLLLATVDKFARLAWEGRASSFLGHGGNRPPDIIIQDELHLIAGPLGSFAGIYEAAIDTVLKYKGVSPKYIASTATIRHAAQQVKSLYGREMAVFPPPGHSIDDSFFARNDKNRPGRLYIGISGCNPLLDWRDTLGYVSATFLSTPVIKQWSNELRDAWWTLVIYHGSLRGVGQSHRLTLHDIPERLNRLLQEEQARLDQEPNESNEIPPNTQSLVRELFKEGQVMELTSHVDAPGIQDVLRRLQKSSDDPESVSVVLCTNMLSVGIDISRLALMIVNGQPLTTAEYIQASSRVGRDRIPGIVLTNYNKTPRDLSHFENFKPYHESFYRFVEPTSVTPFSAPARHLALHAALVIVLRHGVGLRENDDAFLMNPEDGKIKKVIQMFVERCAEADPESSVDVRVQIERLLEEWQRHKRNTLLYQRLPREPMFNNLLRNIFDPPEKGLWETMQSMRSVDRVSHLRIMRPHEYKHKGTDHV